MIVSLQRWGRRLAAVGSISLLAACGGGGGGGASSEPTLQRPPTSEASLAQPSSAEATAAVRAVVAGGDAIAAQSAGGVESFFLPTGPTGAGSPLLARTAANASEREQPMEVVTLACTEIMAPGCSGSVTFDSNADPNAGSIPAGTYVAFTFHGLQGALEGTTMRLDGLLRIDFLTAFDDSASSFANMRFSITAVGLQGAVEGEPFGPETDVALFEFDDQGALSITADGYRFSSIDASVTDDANYRIVAALLRAAYWGDAATYVDTDFTQWNVVAGRAAAGSAASVRAGNARIAISVAGSSAASVAYDVQFLSGGLEQASFRVTASYDPNGVPTYSAAPL